MSIPKIKYHQDEYCPKCRWWVTDYEVCIQMVTDVAVSLGSKEVTGEIRKKAQKLFCDWDSWEQSDEPKYSRDFGGLPWQ